MTRRIVNVAYEAAGGTAVDGYFAKVIKYIPGDVVAGWLLVTSLIKSAPQDVPQETVTWVAFAFGLVFTPVWMWWQTAHPGQKPNWGQVIVSTVAFAVWVFALGDPFAQLSFYRPLYGSLVLIAFTMVSPMLGSILPQGDEPKADEPKQEPGAA